MERRTPEQLLGPLNDVERKNAPAQLFVEGRIELFDAGRRVSVVGTRKPSVEGIARTRALVKALVGRRMVVVSARTVRDLAQVEASPGRDQGGAS